MAASHKVKQTLQYDLPIPILGIYSRELKTCIHTKACSWMFIAASFRIAPHWNNPNVYQYKNR